MRGKVLLGWLGANAEALIALMIAVVAGVLGLTGVASVAHVNSAILVTLAALSLALLRERWRGESEPDTREALLTAHTSLRALPDQIERINSLDGVISDARAALDEAINVRVLTGGEISRVLTEARAEAKEWIFKGGTATFVRAVVIPECVRRARQNRRELTVRLEILDPTDHALCARYANYFRYTVDDPNEDERSWTAKETQIELYATILATCWWQQKYPRLKIAVALSSTMTIFRWDMTQACLVITERGPRFPAMMIKEGRFYYDYWRNELDESFKQARPVPLNRAPALSDVPTVEEARELFARLGMALPESYSDEDAAKVVKHAVDPDNPYG
ncbi:hypothetical protein [Planobispora longispora]|uniref:Uncharacterized protein n=1 Tax=Planobispora longispora TaxID=28887 RepID=A0A8J3W385_9ACTN|nr:hypothetical protein [Planobispora longispora]BFE89055.1 hypothetical protein GCM10020093_116560 [Planobispora longispora]GIH74060.1 hypothetical protein Plo01_04890 [Planobispora longispora]